MEATSLRFAAAARLLGQVSRRRGLDVPAFRSPPRLQGAERSLRRHGSGSATVSVRLRGRPWSAVVSDMIEGVVVANRLLGPTADRTRTALWAAVEADAQRSDGAVAAAQRHVGREHPPAARSADHDASMPRRFPARRPLPTSAPDADRQSRPPLRVVPSRHVA